MQELLAQIQDVAQTVAATYHILIEYMEFLENWGSGAKRMMDACEAQGVEVPTWRSEGGFVTITFKRPDFKTDAIETDKEGKFPLSTPQVSPKYSPSRIAHSKNGRFLYDHEEYG